MGEILPTYIAASSLTTQDLIISLTGFFLFDSVLIGIRLFLMFKFARLGPSSLHTGRYHHEVSLSAGGATLATELQRHAEEPELIWNRSHRS